LQEVCGVCLRNQTISERVEICKGKFKIRSEPDRGTAIEISLPT
jgi:signal transduction histidine kinase